MILVGFMVYYGVPLQRNLLMLPVIVAVVTLLSLAVGTWLSALNVRYRDERTAAGSLYVQNTLVKNNGGSGIVAIGANGPTTVLNDVQSIKNGLAGFVVFGANRTVVALTA